MKRMLSGIKPTGRVTLGNYIGAIKPFVSYQDEYEMIVFVANLHSMTIYQEPKDLRKNTKDLISLYLAAGLDPKKVTLFLQSDVLEHAQLGWYLGCMVSMGELSRMTQYKDKASKLKKDESIGAGEDQQGQCAPGGQHVQHRLRGCTHPAMGRGVPRWGTVLGPVGGLGQQVQGNGDGG